MRRRLLIATVALLATINVVGCSSVDCSQDEPDGSDPSAPECFDYFDEE